MAFESVGAGRSGAALPGRQDCESVCCFIEGLVCAAFGVRLREFRGPSRGSASAAFARQTAMYLAHVTVGLSLSEVGRRFGRDRTTVAHACARVEDGREEAKVERMLGCLEAALDCWRKSVFADGAGE